MNKPLIVIVGPTASGKSSLALDIAKQFYGEIVSADSWMIRKGVDIGTDKPNIEQRIDIPHYMVDIIEPDEDYTAAVYKKEAIDIIDGINSRNKLPILVGGTGLYIDSILYDYSFLPASDPKTRTELSNKSLAELQRMAIIKGLPLDSIDERNKRRVIRLIETNGGIANKKKLRKNTLIIGLMPEKNRLEESIAGRVDTMIAMGLENETRNLANNYGWQCEALKGIGYHEWKLYFEGLQTIDDAKQRIIKDTVLLAKRQVTWFKRNKSIHWFPTPVNYKEIAELVTTYLSKNI